MVWYRVIEKMLAIVDISFFGEGNIMVIIFWSLDSGREFYFVEFLYLVEVMENIVKYRSGIIAVFLGCIY